MHNSGAQAEELAGAEPIALSIRLDLERPLEHVEGLVVALGVRWHAKRGRHPMLKEKQRIVCVLRLSFEAERLPQVSECRATVSRKVLDVRHRRWHLGPPMGLVGRRRHCSFTAVLVCGFELVLRAGFALEYPTLVSLYFLCSLLSLVGQVYGTMFLRYGKAFLSSCQEEVFC